MSRGWVERVWGKAGGRLILGDLTVIALLGLATATLFTSRGEAPAPERVEIEAPGQGVVARDLARDGVIDGPGRIGITRIEVRERRVRVLSSPCPLQVCRHGGWIGETGDALVCLPNEVLVRLPGRRPGAPDAVSR